MAELKVGYCSVTGNVRENNEDSYHVDQRKRYFLVADGMGGQSAGEKASQLAVTIVPERLEDKFDAAVKDDKALIELIDAAVSEANQEIIALGEVDPALNKMGTTLVYLVVADDHIFVGGVGDSRVYRLHGDKFTQETTDHSLTQALLDAGTITPEEAENHKYRNMLYRFLGCKEGGTGTNPERLDLVSGDRYLLCSDGVCDGLNDEGILKVLREHEHAQEAAEKVVRAALDGGSKDNVTCIVVNVE